MFLSTIKRIVCFKSLLDEASLQYLHTDKKSGEKQENIKQAFTSFSSYFSYLIYLAVSLEVLK